MVHKRARILRHKGTSLHQKTKPNPNPSQNDPHQTVNLAANPSEHNYRIANRPLKQILPRLDALMLVLKSCNEDSCRYPWHQLHPDGRVKNLVDALDSSYDDFYSNQPRVSFSKCALGYHIWEEGPQQFNTYHGPGHGDKSSGSRRYYLGVFSKWF